MPNSPLPPLNGTFLPIRPRLSKGPFVGSGMAGNHCKAAAQPGFVLPAFPRDGSIVYPRGGGCRLSAPLPPWGEQPPTRLLPACAHQKIYSPPSPSMLRHCTQPKQEPNHCY